VPRLPRAELAASIECARLLIRLSDGRYENFGHVAVDCLVGGIPVIASDIGAIRKIVSKGEAGLHLALGNRVDLAGKAELTLGHFSAMAEMGAIHARI